MKSTAIIKRQHNINICIHKPVHKLIELLIIIMNGLGCMKLRSLVSTLFPTRVDGFVGIRMTGSRRDIDGSPFNSRIPRVLSGCHETHLPLEIERILRFDINFMLEQVTKQGLLEKVTSFG